MADHDFANDEEAKAQAGLRLLMNVCARIWRANQGLEDRLQGRSLDGTAKVRHEHFDPIVYSLCSQGDRAASIAVLHGVAEQVRQRLLQPRRISGEN